MAGSAARRAQSKQIIRGATAQAPKQALTSIGSFLQVGARGGGAGKRELGWDGAGACRSLHAPPRGGGGVTCRGCKRGCCCCSCSRGPAATGGVKSPELQTPPPPAPLPSLAPQQALATAASDPSPMPQRQISMDAVVHLLESCMPAVTGDGPAAADPELQAGLAALLQQLLTLRLRPPLLMTAVSGGAHAAGKCHTPSPDSAPSTLPCPVRRSQHAFMAAASCLRACHGLLLFPCPRS